MSTSTNFFLQQEEEPVSTTARQILDAALELYLEFGLRRTSMDDVARRVGVTRVTLYRHHADKQALFQAVVMRECWRSMRLIEQKAMACTDHEQRLIEAFVLISISTRQHPLIRRLMDTEPEWLLPYLTTQAGELLVLGRTYVAGYLRHEQARGLLPLLDAELMAELMIRLVQSCALTPGLLASEDDAGLRRIASQFLLPLLQGR
jgi:AcrR family transcriptional regulator